MLNQLLRLIDRCDTESHEAHSVQANSNDELMHRTSDTRQNGTGARVGRTKTTQYYIQLKMQKPM